MCVEHTSPSPTVRLAATTAMTGSGDGSETAAHRYPHHKGRHDGGVLLSPALLVSYVYLEAFLKNLHQYQFRDWVLDSGAFSAHQSGTKIELQAYIDTCKKLLANDPKLTEVFALDVIGDWKASLRNYEEMWKQGVPAIPCYHYGEPEHVLRTLARDYPKIAIGGCAMMKIDKKNAFAGQCFARVWPKKIHGFGFGSERSIMSFPFHSVDATNWELGPCKYGRWASFGQMSVRGSKQNLRSEVEWYLALERRARDRWAKEMALLDDQSAPSVRFACVGTAQGEINGALGGGPTVRLAHKVSGREDNLK